MFIDSMFSFALVMRLALADVTGGLAGISMDHTLERLVYFEYATREPGAENEMVCGPSPVLMRSMRPLACPSLAIGTP